jgi:hypothetical protein
MMNSINMKKKLLPAVIILLVSGILSAAGTEIVFDSKFFEKFNAKHAIERDEYLENILNKIIIARGTIIKVAPFERYKKKYRIIIESSESTDYNQKILYYVFLDNKNTVELLTENSTFEFKGQLMGYTPLVTKRNEYILDVIFMDGSTVIDE